jgi:hypothetical protein
MADIYPLDDQPDLWERLQEKFPQLLALQLLAALNTVETHGFGQVRLIIEEGRLTFIAEEKSYKTMRAGR